MTDPLVERLKTARLSRAITQEDLAERCHITRATISRLERGTAGASVYTLRAMAAALGYRLTLERWSQ